MPALNKSDQPEISGAAHSFEQRSTGGLNLSDAGRAMLHDPAWISEDEADLIMASRIEAKEGNDAVPFDQFSREQKLKRTGRK